MDKELNREILRLSIPSIFANLTVPLVGLVDTAVAGHITEGSSATQIGAISVGSMMFTLLYWCFAFLRTGTGGLTAQAYGRTDMRESARIFYRGMLMAVGFAILVLVLQEPFVAILLAITGGTPEVEQLAGEYFHIRIWAAPATISLMVFRGWFVGMQDSVSSMWTDLTVNFVNIAASVMLSLGVGNWGGIGFSGIALGTVVAQYSGLIYCGCVVLLKYRRKVFSSHKPTGLDEIFRKDENGSFFRMNVNLLLRSMFFTAIYMGYTMAAAGYGDLTLACSSIMMQIMMIFSYFTDGFAYAGEALTGRFIGACDRENMTRSVKYIFAWSMAIAMLFMGIYAVVGTPITRLMTNDPEVIDRCRTYFPWLILMPPLGCAAFTWDGIFLGATASRSLRNSMGGAAICFLLFWVACKAGMGRMESCPETLPLHLLLAAYFSHLAFRTLYLSLRYRKDIIVR